MDTKRKLIANWSDEENCCRFNKIYFFGYDYENYCRKEHTHILCKHSDKNTEVYCRSMFLQ